VLGDGVLERLGDLAVELSGSEIFWIAKSGWKYRCGRTCSPGRIVKQVPDSIRRIAVCIEAGSGTYCSVR